jgi:hypothetical protein
MRTRLFRFAALLLGLLGIPSLIWQIHSAWPLDQLRLYYFGVQAVVLYIFLSFGLGLGPLATGHPLVDPKEDDGDSTEF